MPRSCTRIALLLTACLGPLATAARAELSHEFSATQNHYHRDQYYQHDDGSQESFSVDFTYYKLPRQAIFEVTSDRGQHGRIEAVASDDPLLYDVPCGGITFKDYCPAFDAFPQYQEMCQQSQRRIFVSDTERVALRQEYEAAKQADVGIAPRLMVPPAGARLGGPGKVEVELELMRKPVTPCKQWTFTVVFDRWDREQGSGGKWVSGPHSYSTFQGYEQEVAGGVRCRGKFPYPFMPGRYRVTARAKHHDDRQTPWSKHSEFSVAIPAGRLRAVMAPGFRITAPSPGSTFGVGELMMVHWTSTGIDQRVEVALVQTGNVVFLTPPGGIENRGSLRRNVPAGTKPGVYQLGISTVDRQIKTFVDDITIEGTAR